MRIAVVGQQDFGKAVFEAFLARGDEIVEHPQLASRDVLQTIDSRYGPMRLVGAGFRLAHGSPGIERQPPTLGEHTDEILGEAGYSSAEIEQLRHNAVV